MRRIALLGALVAALLPAATALAQGDEARYALHGGCYALKSHAGGFVAKGDAGYAATAPDPAAAEAFRMQATTLGQYLFYGRARDFLSAGADRADSAAAASDAADWRVDVAGGAFRVVSPPTGRVLAAGEGGALTLADPAAAGDAALFTFERAEGCPAFPEIETSTSGQPRPLPTTFGEVSGFVDAHMHMMAFEFLGGAVHCGRPWHRFGVEQALVDCPDHYPGQGGGAVLENVLFGEPVRTHDPVGWPTFKDWPHPSSLTHETSYYKWLERAWLGGLRVYVNLFVDNEVLCEVYPLKRNPCNEMNTVRLQSIRIRELQDYIDAQHGGPGKGWFRIVTSPFEARRVISEGKLAVVLGIEVSKLFDCGVVNDVPQCTKEDIDRQLDEVHRLGVRDMELVNKFDNAFGGVAGDGGTTGVAVNAANKQDTGKFWEMQTCRTGDEHAHDQPQTALFDHNTDALVGNGARLFVPSGALPAYPPAPHCNIRGLSSLGEHLVNRMIEKGMMIDPDHLGVLARNQLLSITEAKRYSGVVSSHSWSTPDAFPRIYRSGGFVAPYAGSSKDFVKKWRETKPMRDARYYFGFGYGADMNGFGAQGQPRGAGVENPVTYPFKSYDGAVTLDKQRSGERVYDINVDGVSHYGLYPDWIEDLRKQAGDEIVDDMARGSEAYLQMWERAEGVPAPTCRAPHLDFTRAGLGGVRLGASVEQNLRRASQPARRAGRTWTYCVRGRGNSRKKVTAVLGEDGAVALVASNAAGHTARDIGTGDRLSRLRSRTRAFGTGVRARSAGGGTRLVYGIRRGRVRYVAVASREVARTPASLRAALKLAGLA